MMVSICVPGTNSGLANDGAITVKIYITKLFSMRFQKSYEINPMERKIEREIKCFLF